jgi:hypothetical protein
MFFVERKEAVAGTCGSPIAYALSVSPELIEWIEELGGSHLICFLTAEIAA